ncbi:TPA: hypothetical protein QDB11_005222 [Burkholderia vietnamiensis]|uniref:hypothetical protein n=1 Tax=Burkholderia vietnamiensis TaxID=60552 RepID=UPI002653A2A3|nr:hypothetical protein [Burkholderia vietnamiensis]MDN8115475.1 hypothetical protein [Burkholderia vietnamiensis]HDR9140502.1 hypothetical protein [Burkholderia vietnamiensis]
MTISYGTIILALAGAVAGATSAVYWYRSAQVELKRLPAAPYDPNDPLQREPVLLGQKL